MLAPPAAQHCSLHQGPRLLFPNRRQRGTPGDLTSFLSKNNGQASSSTERKGREEDAGQRQLMEKESYQAYVLTPPEPKVTGGGYLPGHGVPGEEKQPPTVLTGTLLDGTLASAAPGPRQCLLWQGSAG